LTLGSVVGRCMNIAGWIRRSGRWYIYTGGQWETYYCNEQK